MVKKKQAASMAPKRLSKFRFVAKGERPAVTIEAESLEAATKKYNNPT